MSWLLILFATTTGMSVVAAYDSLDACTAASAAFTSEAIRNLPDNRPGIFCVAVPTPTN
jgi:hypothetical protein